MVGVFLRLKYRLVGNRLKRASLLGAVGFVLLWLAALGGGIAGGVLITALGRLLRDHRAITAVAVYTVAGVAWVVGPIIAASVDDTLEPRNFELLPIPRRRLSTGLIGAGLVGPGGLMTVLALVLGSVFGYATPISALPILVTALVASVLFVAGARLVTTLLSDLLRARRSQEVIGFLAALLAMLPGIASLYLEGAAVDPEKGLTAVVRWMTVAPPGALGRAVAAFSAQDWGLGVGLLAYGVVTVAVVVWLFGRSLDRLQTRVPRVSAGAAKAGSVFYPRRIPLPVTPVGAVAAKELKWLRRDSRVRAQLLGGGVAVVMFAFALGRLSSAGPYSPFVAGMVAFLVVASVIPNQFGFDGGSFWAYRVMAPDLITVVRGKNLGWAIIASVPTVVVAVLAAVLAGDGRFVIAGILAGFAVLGVWMAVGNQTSVYGAFRLPERSAFGNRNLSGAALVYSFVGLAGSGFFSIPIVLLVGLPSYFLGAVWGTIGSILALGYSWVVYRTSLRLTGPLLAARELTLLEIIDRQ